MSSFRSLAALAFVGAALASPAPIIESRDFSYSNHKVWTFDGNALPAGLSASNYDVSDHKFSSNNVAVRDGFLELIVPGGQASQPSGAEVVTDVSNIKYASVRTTAILTDTHGVCNGFFFYNNDSPGQESDVEWLSDPDNTSDQGTRHLWFTNQENDGDGKKTFTKVTAPADAVSAPHEYRIDWTPSKVQWYVDGVLKFQTAKDIPSVPGNWVFNNWSNGNRGWSAGPPAKDAVLKISKIEMYYNTA